MSDLFVLVLAVMVIAPSDASAAGGSLRFFTRVIRGYSRAILRHSEIYILTSAGTNVTGKNGTTIMGFGTAPMRRFMTSPPLLSIAGWAGPREIGFM